MSKEELQTELQAENQNTGVAVDGGVTGDNVVTLIAPITRGDMVINTVTITDAMRHPGALRGLKLFEVMQGDVNSLIKLLPRVTSPMLTEADVYAMDSSDFSALSIQVVNFFAR
ncbi:phage tail assembly protein [Escherichia coli]|uniref:phage tail assembly protein n=1 Tax=Escherichia coli TaxID=562 RepID=UPI002878651C|nr:phage tail assembly protein [Escherichia coli]MDS1619943.1 phage tail assembly protein [Escherichia coli]